MSLLAYRALGLTAALAAVLAVACDGGRISSQPVPTVVSQRQASQDEIRSAAATKPVASAPAPGELPGLAAFDASLRSVGLTRDGGDGAPELFSSACSGDATIRVTVRGRQISLRFGGCMRCELTPPSEAAVTELDPKRIGGFGRALGETPPEFLHRAEIERVVLCWRLSPEARADAGAYDNELIGGLTDHKRHAILLSLQPMDLSGEDIVHHELFHLFEVMTSADLLRGDPEWIALNPAGFAYLNRDADVVTPGFLNRHAMANVREDRATVYQFLMARPTELCAAGAIVLAKARLIRDRVAAVLGNATYLEKRAPCLTTGAR